MIIKTIEKVSLAFVFSVFVLLSGCSGVSETNAVKNVNANQAIVVSNVNTNANSSVGSNNAVAANTAVNGNESVKTVTPSKPPAIADVIANVTNAANKKSATPANQSTPQIGSGSDDLLLVVQIKGALTAADSSFTNSVIVDGKQGNVVLSGNVPNEAARAKAVQVAQGVKGVKKVQNSLHVSQ